MQRPPAEPGMSEDQIDTPALVIDLDALESNLDAMAAYCKKASVRLRAHAKTHKSPVIARWQALRGAVGQCVQKVGEAEVLAWGGVDDILISNEVIGPQKIARLAALSRMSTVALCADDMRGIEQIEAAAQFVSSRLTVLVEINVGSGRCGVDPGAPAVVLAQRIARSKHLVFGGLQAYHGGAQHMRLPGERETAVGIASEMTRRTVEQLSKAGLPCPVVGGAGTGTFAIEALGGVYNEIQAGSYVFMDVDYSRNKPPSAFRQSLFVLATVMSAARDGVAVVDCGHKGMAIDSGMPLVDGREDIIYSSASDEHGTLRIDGAGNRLSVGERLRLVPGHCDPTVDRYDWYVGVRNRRVEMVFPVAARGMMQ